MSVSYPTTSLQPGSTNTAAVKQLQDWLVANGFMTQADVNTGYGTYGPRTTAAVLKVQQKYGVDNSTGPGYWGPRTITAVQSSPTSATATKTTAPTTSPQKAVLSAIADVAETASTTGKPPVSFADALALAAKDPNIVAKYADMAKLDKQSFLQVVQQMQQTASSQFSQYRTQFENERKQLSEMQAAAGTAYSGFRGKAQADLAQTESGIVTSARAQQQQALNQLTSAFEAKYGTGATPKASISEVNPLTGNVSLSGLATNDGGNLNVTGDKAGGITGTVTAEKQSDILGSAWNSYNTTLFPQV